MKNSINMDEINKTLSIGTKKKSFLRRFWWWLILLLIAVLFFFLKANESESVVHYNSVQATKQDLIVTVSATGNLEPTNSVNIGIEVSGTLAEILVDYNDIVKQGQILAKLDTTKLESRVNSSKASLEVAKANLLESKLGMNDARYELRRVQGLFKSTNGNYPPKREIDKAKVLYQKSKATNQALLAKVHKSEAGLKSDEDDLKKAVVISPIDGIVLDKLVEIGQSVVASMQIPTLFTLAEDLKKMEVVVSVDEADVGEVKKGQKVTFSVDAYSLKIFEGVIKQVRMNSQIVNNVVTYETVVSVGNEELLLRPGMTVSADITTKIFKDQILVPNVALRFSPPKIQEKKSSDFVLFGPPPIKEKIDLSANTKRLWILEAGKAKAVPVEFGASDGVNTIVFSDIITTDTKIILGIQENIK